MQSDKLDFDVEDFKRLLLSGSPTIEDIHLRNKQMLDFLSQNEHRNETNN